MNNSMMDLRDDMAPLWVLGSAWKESASVDGSVRIVIYSLFKARRLMI
jgi:hypothetical protein